MNLHYNQNYTLEEVSSILQTIHGCIRTNQFIIAQNESRQENINFITEYNITNKKSFFRK